MSRPEAQEAQMAVKKKKKAEESTTEKPARDESTAGGTSPGGPQKRDLTRPELERLRERLQKKFH